MMFKKVSAALAAAGLILAFAAPAIAQSYPDRPITLYVGLAAGGGTDLLARALAANMEKTLGQPVVVENLPGASGTIAGQKVATAEADGYSLILVTASEAILPAVRNDLPYDVTKAFAPIDLISENAYLVTVTDSFPAKTLQDLVDVAKADPGSVNYGSAGVGSHAHVVTAAMALAAGISMEHIPFKGNSEVAVAVASGTVDVSLITQTAAKPLLDSGKIRALAITSKERSDVYPDVPTVEEAGIPDFAYGTWYALLTTAGTPDDVVGKLHDAAEKAIESPALADFFVQNGMTKRGSTPADAASFIASEVAAYGKVIADAGIKLE
jgi:tripartite-type tricarboxylate transporter receptor subunit TctC